MAKASARFVDGKVKLVKCFDMSFCKSLIYNEFLKDWYLDELEAAYQASKGQLSVNGAEGWDAVFRILEECGIKIPLFLVYLDLRSRGRRVRRGIRPGTLLVRYNRTIEVLVLEEGSPVTVRWMIEWSRQAVADGFDPVIAVVDRNGSVTYYEARVVEELS